MGQLEGIEEKFKAEYHFSRLASLGDFYELKVFFEPQKVLNQLERLNPEWVPYNRNKTWSNRYGISLFSLNGETSGEIDLNSIKEWNQGFRNGSSNV